MQANNENDVVTNDEGNVVCGVQEEGTKARCANDVEGSIV